jgi:hypothetical protein
MVSLLNAKCQKEIHMITLFVMTCLLWNCSTCEVQCTYLIYAVLIYCYNIRLLLVKMSRYTYKDTHTVVYCDFIHN